MNFPTGLRPIRAGLPLALAAAEADTKRMIDLGVEYFQIDSPYDVWLR